MDRQSADAAATIPGVSAALHDTTLDDVPDVLARPLPELGRGAAQANAYADDVRYAMAGQNLGALLAELHRVPVSPRGMATTEVMGVHLCLTDPRRRQAPPMGLTDRRLCGLVV